MIDAPDSVSVLGPKVAEAEPISILGKLTRLRIHLEGCKGLPPIPTRSSGGGLHARHSYSVIFQTISRHHESSQVNSVEAREGTRALRGTVQWNEVLYLDCMDLGLVAVTIMRDGSHLVYNACLSVRELLSKTEIVLWPFGNRPRHLDSTLFLHASQVYDHDRDKKDCRPNVGPDDSEAPCYVIDSRSWIGRGKYAPHTTGSWHALFSRFSAMMAVIDYTKINTWEGFWAMTFIYDAYSSYIDLQPYFDSSKCDALMTSMVEMIDIILSSNQLVNVCTQDRTVHMAEVFTQLEDSAHFMASFINPEFPQYERMLSTTEFNTGVAGYVVEFSRLAWVIATPNPTSGPSSTSASSNYHTLSGTVGKDALLFVLEAIVESSDAFPPLKSAASGLFFFATYADMASGNKTQIRDIYKRIDGLVDTLKHSAREGNSLTPEHRDAISTLAKDIKDLNEDLENIVAERKSRFKRFFGAKRHRDKLQNVVTQLEAARANYTTAVATLNATTNAQVLAHVQALTLFMGVLSVPKVGTRRADAVVLPSRPTCIEEV